MTEAKGLGWLLVGMVTCASTEFFVARPQLMMVDVTELGTIKLQLEVTWKYAHTHRGQRTHDDESARCPQRTFTSVMSNMRSEEVGSDWTTVM